MSEYALTGHRENALQVSDTDESLQGSFDLFGSLRSPYVAQDDKAGIVLLSSL